MKGQYIKTPDAPVIVKSVASSGMLFIPRDNGQPDLKLGPGGKATMPWAEFVRIKNIPGFGRFIELDDSVKITSDGYIRIAETESKFTEEAMVQIFVLPLAHVKEELLGMPVGDRKMFQVFLKQRKELGIDEEKCIELLSFISSNSLVPVEPSDAPKKVVDEQEPEVPLSSEPVLVKHTSTRRGRSSEKSEGPGQSE